MRTWAFDLAPHLEQAIDPESLAEALLPLASRRHACQVQSTHGCDDGSGGGGGGGGVHTLREIGDTHANPDLSFLADTGSRPQPSSTELHEIDRTNDNRCCIPVDKRRVLSTSPEVEDTVSLYTNTNTHAHTHTKTRKAVSRCSGDVVVTDGQEIVDAVTGIGKIRTQLVLYNTPIISVQCIPVPGATGGE